ncbi:MAG: hypothetical protein ACUVSY_11585, partial [Roseiflexus sp.]
MITIPRRIRRRADAITRLHMLDDLSRSHPPVRRRQDARAVGRECVGSPWTHRQGRCTQRLSSFPGRPVAPHFAAAKRVTKRVTLDDGDRRPRLRCPVQRDRDRQA